MAEERIKKPFPFEREEKKKKDTFDFIDDEMEDAINEAEELIKKPRKEGE